MLNHRLIVTGGFFGAGKTSAIARLATFLRSQALNVAVITLSGGGESVDTLRLRARDLPVEELSLRNVQAQMLEGILRKFSDAVVLVEAPGGSLNFPGWLAKLSGSTPPIGPLTCVVDAVRAQKVLGLNARNRFSEKVSSIYREQIEEASIVLINRADAIPPEALSTLREALSRLNPRVVLDLKAGTGVAEWWNCLNEIGGFQSSAPKIDPAIRAEAESSLAALNCTVRLSTVKYFDGNKILLEACGLAQNLLRQESAEIAHLKLLLFPSDGASDYASASVTGHDTAPELSELLAEPIQSGRLILNLRAEGDPENLHSSVNRALLALVEHRPELFARMDHCEHFRPAPYAPASLTSDGQL